MSELELKHLFEVALLAAGRPVTTQQLAELFDERERPSLEQVLNALNDLRQDYEGRGLELLEVSSGWRIQVRNNCVDFVSRLWQERPTRYSRALLETLALIAYRQPITRGEIEEIRGVAVSSTMMRTLYDRNWIRVVGHREVPGRPEVLATTREFLDYFGLKSLDQLPTLAELKDVETIGVQLEFNTSEALIADDDATQPVSEPDDVPADIEVASAATQDVVETQTTASDEQPAEAAASEAVEHVDAIETGVENEREAETASTAQAR
jgi:segregation and condensation protein B